MSSLKVVNSQLSDSAISVLGAIHVLELKQGNISEMYICGDGRREQATGSFETTADAQTPSGMQCINTAGIDILWQGCWQQITSRIRAGSIRSYWKTDFSLVKQVSLTHARVHIIEVGELQRRRIIYREWFRIAKPAIFKASWYISVPIELYAWLWLLTAESSVCIARTCPSRAVIPLCIYASIYHAWGSIIDTYLRWNFLQESSRFVAT